MVQNTQNNSNYMLEVHIWGSHDEAHLSHMAQWTTPNYISVLNITITHYMLIESNES